MLMLTILCTIALVGCSKTPAPFDRKPLAFVLHNGEQIERFHPTRFDSSAATGLQWPPPIDWWLAAAKLEYPGIISTSVASADGVSLCALLWQDGTFGYFLQPT